jgi:hypothetical protein
MRRRSQLGRMRFALATYGALCASAHSIGAPSSRSVTFESRSGATLALLEQAQHDLKRADLHSARHAFEAAITALDRDDAVDHTALIAALTELASSLNALHEHEAAIAPARRALAYLRSRQGLYAPEQRALLESPDVPCMSCRRVAFGLPVESSQNTADRFSGIRRSTPMA